MQWADVTATPSSRTLRQFAGLWLVFLLTLAAWLVLHDREGVTVFVLAALGIGVGALGLARPTAIRLLYTGWMIAAFPVGWTISRLILAGMFYGVFTPMALAFRLMGRDCLGLRHRDRVRTYWTPKSGISDVRGYFRQF